MDRSHVLVIHVTCPENTDYTAMRNYILESVGLGVLVLPEDASCEVMELPRLGGVEVARSAPTGEPRPTPEPEPALEPKPEKLPATRKHDVGPMGRNAAEKRAIMERLKAYREAHGLGCWAAVSKAGGGKITEEQLRDMTAGTVLLPIAKWRLAAVTLAKLEAAE